MNNFNISILKDVNIPEYHVSLIPDKLGSFQQQLNSLVCKYKQLIKESELESKYLVFSKIFLSDYINQKPLIENHTQFNAILENAATSMIEQSPLDGTKINLLLYFVKTDDIIIKKNNDTYFIKIGSNVHIYQSVTKYDNKSRTPYEQTNDAFSLHIKLLSDIGLSLKDNCVRTWLYSRDVDKDYAGIVKARNDIFERQGLTINSHFIASTGIEGRGFHLDSSVNIDFYSIKGICNKQIQYLQALDYLNNTYEYGVAFERGTCITYPDKKHIFISGTASIDKSGECVHLNDVIKQAERLFLNIKMLLKDVDADLSDIAQIIVYLRNISDYDIICSYLDINFTSVPRVVVQARVCRPEWLIEVECIATKQTLEEIKL